jgi:hypothetical protein
MIFFFFNLEKNYFLPRDNFFTNICPGKKAISLRLVDKLAIEKPNSMVETQ